MCSSPRLFAAYHVFHRLPVPGHPPCALLCLTSLYHPRSPSGSQGRSKNGSYTPPQANLRRVFLCSLVLLAIAFSICGSVDRSSVHPACLFFHWRCRKASLYLGTAPFFSLPLKKDPSHSGQFAGLQLLIRVIDSNFFYQRRGLMFDVFSIQFSRYGRRIAVMHLWRFARHQHSGSPSWMLIACKAMSFRFE